MADDKKLPVLLLQRTEFSRLARWCDGFLGSEPVTTIPGAGGQVRYRAGSRHVDFDQTTGMVYAADNGRFMIRSEPLSGPRSIPSVADTIDLFDSSLTARLSPLITVSVQGAPIARHWFSAYDMETGVRRDEERTAVQSVYATLKVNTPDGAGLSPLPIFNDIGRASLALNGSGDLVQFYVAWQEGALHQESRLVPEDVTDQIIRDMFPEVVSFAPPVLGYAVTTIWPAPRFLEPVRLYRPRLAKPGGTVRARSIAVPATEWGLERWAMGAAASGSACDVFQTTTSCAAGAMWLGDTSVSRLNGEAFLSLLPRRLWSPKFNCSEAAVTYDKWLMNSANWTESVCAAFYDGHADDTGWKVAGGYYVEHADLKAYRLGDGGLRWLIVAACGPLHDRITTANQNLQGMQRWSNVFGGLRMMLAYGSETQAIHPESHHLMAFVDPKEPLKDAWARVAKLTQRSTDADGNRVWASILYGFDHGALPPVDDQPFADGGVTAPDPQNARFFEAFWVPL